MRPSKQILSTAHLRAFQRSSTHADILAFVTDLDNAVVGVKLGDAEVLDTRPLLDMIDAVDTIAQQTPPIDNAQSRFGNPAFQTFYDKVKESSPSLHASLVPAEHIEEVSTYFEESWGNRQRVDYGSGMEYNFLCWMLCLVKLGVVQASLALVLRVFWRYIQVMRRLQSTYWLEPAGSHGVWGLDDYQFLPFLWGAGQLRDHKHLKPKSIHNPEVLEAFSADYMYLSCIAFVNSIKTASLRWHSPMLDDISAVKTWDKVNSGMIKMFTAEVLGKLPVMQHALFGTLLPYVGDELLQRELESEGAPEKDSHGHVHEGWSMDCCGIPVPSAFAEVQSRTGIKPIPFD